MRFRTVLLQKKRRWFEFYTRYLTLTTKNCIQDDGITMKEAWNDPSWTWHCVQKKKGSFHTTTNYECYSVGCIDLHA